MRAVTHQIEQAKRKSHSSRADGKMEKWKNHCKMKEEKKCIMNAIWHNTLGSTKKKLLYGSVSRLVVSTTMIKSLQNPWTLLRQSKTWQVSVYNKIYK